MWRVASGNKLKCIVRIFCKNALFLNVNLMLHAVKAKAHLTGFSVIVVFCVYCQEAHTEFTTQCQLIYFSKQT